MGKYLNNSDIVMRTGKLAFLKCLGESFYRRMEGFTELSNSKGTKEYTRQYVDEDFERTDVSGYSPEISYAFDRYKANPVLDDIIHITENELIGQAMVRDIVVLDMTTAVSNNGTTWTAEGKMRKWAVIPDTDGDTTDCMTYSGTLKCRGEMIDVRATTTDDWQTITVVNIASEKTAFAIVSVSDIDGVEIGSITPTVSFERLEVNNATNGFTINATSTVNGATVTLLSGSNITDSASNSISRVFQQSGSAGTVSEYTVICTHNGNSTSVIIKVTKVDTYDET
ncbi:MAG: hypothetical protein ACI4WH_00560 [Oscillospiraceae bacterium]